MRSHKYNSDDHNYCKRCDYDGKDWDDLLQHKIDAMAPFIVGEKRNDKHKEMMHIVCEFCGMEFKSFAGHERHRTQVHYQINKVYVFTHALDRTIKPSRQLYVKQKASSGMAKVVNGSDKSAALSLFVLQVSSSTMKRTYAFLSLVGNSTTCGSRNMFLHRS